LIFPQSDDIRKIVTSKEAYKDIEAKTNFQKKKKFAELLKEKIKEYLEILEGWQENIKCLHFDHSHKF